jgi:hypothetical protein
MEDFHVYSDVRLRNHCNRWLKDTKLCDSKNSWKYTLNLPCSKSYRIEVHFLRNTNQCLRGMVLSSSLKVASITDVSNRITDNHIPASSVHLWHDILHLSFTQTWPPKMACHLCETIHASSKFCCLATNSTIIEVTTVHCLVNLPDSFIFAH